MSRIPFTEARFFNLNDTRSALETRFETYLRRLRGRRSGLPPEDLGNECDALPDPFWKVNLSGPEQDRIRRRARRIFERRKGRKWPRASEER